MVRKLVRSRMVDCVPRATEQLELRGVPGGGTAGGRSLEAVEVGLLELTLEQSMLLRL